MHLDVYQALERHDRAIDRNFFAAGPWYHCQHSADGSRLAALEFDEDTAKRFREDVLEPFLRRFPRDSVHLMLFDDIRADPAAAYRGICRFLEIDPAFVPPSLNQRVNPRTVLRSQALLRLRCVLRDIFASTAATRKAREAIARFGPSRRIALKLFRLNEKPGTPPPLAPETRRRLVEFYRKDTDALGELLNRDLSPWNEWKERAP